MPSYFVSPTQPQRHVSALSESLVSLQGPVAKGESCGRLFLHSIIRAVVHSEIEVGECLSTKSRGVQDPYRTTVTFARQLSARNGARSRGSAGHVTLSFRAADGTTGGRRGKIANLSMCLFAPRTARVARTGSLANQKHSRTCKRGSAARSHPTDFAAPASGRLKPSAVFSLEGVPCWIRGIEQSLIPTSRSSVAV